MARGINHDPPPPTAEELADALGQYLEAERTNREAYTEMTKLRERLVDLLHRSGLRGFHL